MTNINGPINKETQISSSLLPNRNRQKTNGMSQSRVSDPKPDVAIEQLMKDHKAMLATKLIYQSMSVYFSKTTSFFNSTVNNGQRNLAEIEVSQAPQAEEENQLFDFKLVAENVMSFISKSILAAEERGDSEGDLREMLNQARSGVEQGISGAKDELTDMSLLDEGLTLGIDKSQELINIGIDKLEEKLFDVEKSANEAVLASQELHSSQSYKSDLTITTRDGDNINISFNSFNQASQYQQLSMSADNNEFGYQKSQTMSKEYNFSFSIDGEIDELEAQAIKSLVEDVAKLQKNFFKGDIEKAFSQAQQLNFNYQELSSLDLDLSVNKTSVASQKYTEVARVSDEEDKPSNQEVATQLKPVLDFIQQFKQLETRAKQLLSTNNNQMNSFYDEILVAELKAASSEGFKNNLARWQAITNKLSG